jgi:hypothetical protein
MDARLSRMLMTALVTARLSSGAGTRQRVALPEL